MDNVIALTEELVPLLKMVEDHPEWTSERIRKEAEAMGVLPSA